MTPRELKFRTWEPVFGMHEPWTLKEKTEFHAQLGTKVSDIDWMEGTIFMQFTGLKDQNGKEIYEGDVLASAWDTMLNNWLVEFEDGAFVFVNIGVKGYLGTRFRATQASFDDRVLVGNIHENQNLLKL